MFIQVESEEWQGIEAGNNTVLLVTDMSAIYRPALTCADKSWALQRIAGMLKLEGRCILATRRNSADDAWLILITP